MSRSFLIWKMFPLHTYACLFKREQKKTASLWLNQNIAVFS
ncbi:hypothetical protein FTV88_2558 [Heliorestis convoluta]|uniref:Uncharacterized protein n=1 Tax=Heliorestis convoluta TaxID=356322 RepID=A0A5Q2N2Z3_9FIRM|nr:hypothetical protein FTV88_2558 [Heliorestis convoluta]